MERTLWNIVYSQCSSCYNKHISLISLTRTINSMGDYFLSCSKRNLCALCWLFFWLVKTNNCYSDTLILWQQNSQGEGRSIHWRRRPAYIFLDFFLKLDMQRPTGRCRQVRCSLHCCIPFRNNPLELALLATLQFQPRIFFTIEFFLGSILC